MSVEPFVPALGEGTADQMAAAISRLIIDGEFGPGDRLKLSDLAHRFGVSLTPIREALWKLEGAGLVSNLPNRGAVVRQVDAQHITNVYEVRGAIEAALIERTAARATSADLDLIETAREAVQQAVQRNDPRAILTADAVFHDTLNQVAGNGLAIAILQGTLPLIRSIRLRAGFDPRRLAAMLREHNDITAAIRDGDGRLAAQRVRLHLNGAREAMLAALEALPRPATRVARRQAAPRR